MPDEIRFFGWVPDSAKDKAKDKPYALRLAAEAPAALPSRVDLRETGRLPAVYNQGQLGSCVWNATAGALEYLQALEGAAERFTPSRLWGYYNTRTLEGTRDQDAGCQIRDAIKVVAHLGCPPEADWPYQPERFRKCPPFASYIHARQHQAVEYFRVDWHSPQEVKACLAAGFPIIFGATLFESFEDCSQWKDGTAPMPGRAEVEVGGHAMLLVGFDDARDCYLVRNSWGADWNAPMAGHFWMPAAYIHGPLSDDFWTIRKVEV